MVATVDPTYRRGLHPLHAVLLAGTVPLFLGALLSDIAYARTYNVQWTNFASWLIVGGLVFGTVVLVLALVDLFRRGHGVTHRRGRQVIYFLLVLATWVLALVDALVHGKDAWAVMPGGLVLSVVVFLLACAATWLGFAGYRAGGAA